jgi:hypothetical protein
MKENRIRESIWTPSKAEIEKEKAMIKERIEKVGTVNLERLITWTVNQWVPEMGEVPPGKYRKVGLLTSNGKIVTYSWIDGELPHAEAEIFQAARYRINDEIEVGNSFTFDAIVISQKGDNWPCGKCRETIMENAGNCLILLVDPSGDNLRTTSLKTLYPYV